MGIFVHILSSSNVTMLNGYIQQICKEHPNCEGCTFVGNGVQTQTGVVFCEIGMSKGEDKNENKENK